MSNHPRCENCLHWQIDEHVIDEFEAPICSLITDKFMSGTDSYKQSIGIRTPKDFYCTLHERKEKWEFSAPPKVGED